MIAMMTVTAFVGTILELRFKVLALVPAIGASSVTILGAAIAHGNSLWSVLVAVLLAVTTLQIGYLTGTVMYLVLVKSRARKQPSNVVAVTQRR